LFEEHQRYVSERGVLGVHSSDDIGNRRIEFRLFRRGRGDLD
jgi:hypothetical protein